MFSFWRRPCKDQVERLLQVMGHGMWVTNMELGQKVCLRYGDVIYRARKRGYKIADLQINRGLWKYKLIKDEDAN
jgi:hypothetical protein